MGEILGSLDALIVAAEAEWLEKWTAGPSEGLGVVLAPGAAAPSFSLRDHEGSKVELADVWADGPALVMFWRHFGCSCGMDRASRLVEEAEGYANAGLNPVLICQAEPERAAAYRTEHGIPYPLLCDPDLVAYRAYGVGQFSIEQVLWEVAPEYYNHSHEIGVEFQIARREQGRPLVDDPWRAMAEFVVGQSGIIRLAHQYQWCEDFPYSGVITTAAYLADS